MARGLYKYLFLVFVIKKLLLLLLTLGFIGSANAISSPDDLFTTTCKEESLEGLQRVGDNWESAERPLRTYLVTKVKESSKKTLLPS
mgnify:CR=1 FL=1